MARLLGVLKDVFHFSIENVPRRHRVFPVIPPTLVSTAEASEVANVYLCRYLRLALIIWIWEPWIKSLARLQATDGYLVRDLGLRHVL